MFLDTFSGIVGAVILISVLLPWFLIALAIVSVLYAVAAAFYRASSREAKVRASQTRSFDVVTERRSQRLDAILRSLLYSHFSESLSGTGTIRAYREEGRFLKENRDRVDIENRAYWLTVINQVCCFLYSKKCARAVG
jgi:ABC-type multidrug transport system fused ATPase/permease subunit